MKWMKLMMLFAALVSCSVASAQVPNPVPDPGPGGGPSVCEQCADLRAQFDELENIIAELYDTIADLNDEIEGYQQQRTVIWIYLYPVDPGRWSANGSSAPNARSELRRRMRP
jgi:hypothetical protein